MNGQQKLTFSNPRNNDDETREIEGEDGVSLSFFQSMVDNNGDQMGYAVLTLPKKMITPGKPVNIKVNGVENNSAAWYMTFKIKLSDDLSVTQLKTIKKKDNKHYNTLRFDVVHLADNQKAEIWVDDQKREVNLITGLNELDFDIPKVLKPQEVKVGIKVGSKAQEETMEIKPVKEWTVYLMYSRTVQLTSQVQRN